MEANEGAHGREKGPTDKHATSRRRWGGNGAARGSYGKLERSHGQRHHRSTYDSPQFDVQQATETDARYLQLIEEEAENRAAGYTPGGTEHLNRPFEAEETEGSIDAAQMNKVPGQDNVTNKLVKRSGTPMVSIIFALFSYIDVHEVTPTEWEAALQ